MSEHDHDHLFPAGTNGYVVAIFETEEQLRASGRLTRVLDRWQPYLAPSRVEIYRDLGERGEIRESGVIQRDPNVTAATPGVRVLAPVTA